MKNQARIEEILKQDLDDYRKLSQAGEHYDAAVRIAEVFACLPFLRAPKREQWAKTVRSQTSPRKWFGTIQRGVHQRAKHIRKILSIGDRWDEDEFVLVILIRSEFDLLQRYISVELGKALELPSQVLDDLIEQSVVSRANRRAYKAAVEQIQRNRPLPFENRWLNL